MSLEESEAEVPENYVKLISSDGFEFIIDEECAKYSKVIRTNLESGFRESRTRCIPLNDIRGELLEKACQYLYHIRRYNNVMKAQSLRLSNLSISNNIVSGSGSGGGGGSSRLYMNGGRSTTSSSLKDLEKFDELPDDALTVLELLLIASYLDI
eukprot:Plantae.Rhodophyta-Hildenbrandia_rubra.ctg17669.p1 GENE.Plantae.Rhodophyta-Hildenbrandia_rubra.ctg17669~~Plantae.Rhodophyta-Hildenbrandia_rubra.ctg17669.p1  ORF type:complete len:154 (+),score=29.97 Plantae.Rhodophyta-Hildenbrandia_rubra.ctg17669:397-858(+)